MIEETTKVGVVNNCLAYLNNCSTKGHFSYGLMLGLGSNFNYVLRKEFIAMVCQVSGERLADPKNLLLNYWDQPRACWAVFTDCKEGGLKIEDLKNPEEPPVVMTSTI